MSYLLLIVDYLETMEDRQRNGCSFIFIKPYRYAMFIAIVLPVISSVGAILNGFKNIVCFKINFIPLQQGDVFFSERFCFVVFFLTFNVIDDNIQL